MLETMLITFREGLEAFLIVAIMLAYVTKTGRTNLIKPIYAGIVASVLLCGFTGFQVASMAENPAWEGFFALLAGALVATMTVYVMKTAGNISGEIKARIDRESEKDDSMAEIGIFAFTVLMISREGMETAMMLGAISGSVDAAMMMTGAALGITLVAIIGYMWVKQSHRINLKLFMQVTGIFLVLFSIHLFTYGFHELTETELLPLPDHWVMTLHTLSEPLESGEPIGQAILYSMVVVPCLWIAVTYFRNRSGDNKVISRAAE